MNSRRSVLFTIVIFAGTILFAQDQVEVRKKEFRNPDQSEGFKEAWKSVKEGDKYFEQGRGTYPLALDHYLFANQYNNNNPELNYKIGTCYLQTDNKMEAIDYLLKAFDLDPSVTPDIKFRIARAYHLAEEFDKARQFYREYRQEIPSEEKTAELNSMIDKLIIECGNGDEFTKTPRRVIIQNLGDQVNSAYDDYNPVFAYHDSALYFTSRRPAGKKAHRNELDNKYYENIFVAPADQEGFAEAYLLGKPFNEKGNISLVEVAPDGTAVYVYIGSEDGGDIEAATYITEKGKWKKPKSVSKRINTDFEETTAAMTPAGDELYFVSSNPEISNGGKDILVSRLDPKGKWGEPVNIGGLINSRYDEEGVFLSADGQTLYFASRGHNTMGGFDIFKSEMGEDGRWGPPENLGYPVNTPDDEVFYITDSTGVYGYYSTVRDGGLGGKDIYKVIALGAEKEVTTMTRDSLIAGLQYFTVNPFLTLPEPVDVDTTLLLSGQVRDTVGNADTTILASLSFMDPETGEVVARAMTGKDGRYRARIPEPKIYGVEINATGYLYFLDILDLSGLNPDEPAEHDFYLQRIEVGTKVVLDNIYFETGKSVLTVASYESLDQVARFLENNESVRLEISGHTDNTGSLRVNTRLSEARAKAVVDYLVGRGIDQGRLEYKGYADSQPVAPNDTPEGREKNRRVEFKVLSK